MNTFKLQSFQTTSNRSDFLKPTSKFVHKLFFLVIIKLACESQLTEILFKLIIKLACESQLTEILFKLLIIIILFMRLKFLTATPPRALTLQTPNSVQIFRLISPGVLYLYIFSN